jgi:DNA-directed RNA polymerase sigma subunit (sigma70/sigma32)
MMNAVPVDLSSIVQGNALPCTLASSAGTECDLLAQYCRDIATLSLLSADEESALAARVQSGDQGAKQKLIEGNVRLVIHVAKEYTGCGLDLIDLIQEGNIGLLKAVDRFDPSMGFRFSWKEYSWK